MNPSRYELCVVCIQKRLKMKYIVQHANFIDAYFFVLMSQEFSIKNI
jgi:hypothetical protein